MPTSVYAWRVDRLHRLPSGEILSTAEGRPVLSYDRARGAFDEVFTALPAGDSVRLLRLSFDPKNMAMDWKIVREGWAGRAEAKEEDTEPPLAAADLRLGHPILSASVHPPAVEWGEHRDAVMGAKEPPGSYGRCWKELPGGFRCILAPGHDGPCCITLGAD